MKIRFQAKLNCVLAVLGAFLAPTASWSDSYVGSVVIQADVSSVNAASRNASLVEINIATIEESSISGEANLSVELGNIVAAATGQDNESQIAVATVENSSGNEVVLDILTGDVLNLTVGTGSSGLVKIGTVTNTTTGSVNMSVVTGNIINLSVGSGRNDGAVLIGTMGNE